ncbi:MAG: endonuclease III [Oligoflexales bacterium]|nr:endonuclease III [Oligoflexales bacterium]
MAVKAIITIATPKKLQSLIIREKRTLKLMQVFAQENPDPRCELFYKTPYQLLISVVLSAQATDISVNKCMRPLYEKDLDLEAVLKLGELGLLKKIKSIGLAPTKAKNILALSRILKSTYNSQVPPNREALESLPGVGRKTASVILGELFAEPTIAVDTHVFRVSARLGLHQEKTPEKCEKILEMLIPAVYLPRAHHWFILHGRYICKAKNPACSSCHIAEYCPSKLDTANKAIPRLNRKIVK